MQLPSEFEGKDVGVDGDAQRIGQLVWTCCSWVTLKIYDDRKEYNPSGN